MSTSPDFGELRSLLAVSPSAEAFDAVIDYIEAALPALGEQAYLDQWDPYVESTLRRWPDATRRVREDRLKALEATPAPWGPQVRTLEYAGSVITEKRCAGLCEAEHLANITRLDLRDASTSWGVIRQIAEGAPFVLDAFALRKSTSSGAAPKDLIPLFTSPMLSELESLEFTWWSRFGAKSMQTLLAHLPLGRLRKLDLHDTGIGKSGLKALLECEDLSALEHLDLGRIEFNDRLSRSLGEATHLRSLRRLGLALSSFSPAAIGEIADTPHIVGLERLDLSNVELELDDVRALVAPEAWPNLRHLDVSGSRLSSEALGALMGASCFEQVEALLVGKNTLAEASFEAAADWTSLRSLNLDGSTCHAGGWRALTEAPFWGRLESLSASRVVPTDLWDDALASPLPPRLESLDLSSNHLGQEHVPLLIRQQCTSTLRRLDLGSYLYAVIPSLSEGLEQLAQASFPELRTLVLHYTIEDQASLARLVASEHLGNLGELLLTSRGASPSIAPLREAAPAGVTVWQHYR